jgi:anthranilate phosphoribosyltransferase
MSMKGYIEKCLEEEHLSEKEAGAALDLIMTNQATEVEIAGLLIALRAKGETIDEIVGFARTMRSHAVHIEVEDPDAIDMCGTGGDGRGTFNISTVASFVVAGAHVTVAKHGNRSVSSQSGSADLLSALDVNIQLPPEKVQECINTVGVGFLFAPLFHPAMKYAAKTRKELGVRTIFNMLGPITNPAGVRRQLVGTYRIDVARQLAGALGRMGTARASVVHSADGLDEASVAAPTTIVEISENAPDAEHTVSAADFGLRQHPAADVAGGTTAENAAIALSVLCGAPGAQRDVVIANAALGLMVAGKAHEERAAAALAAHSIDSGRALRKLNELIAFTKRA